MFTPTESELVFQNELAKSLNKLQTRSYTTIKDIANLIEREKKRYAREVLDEKVALPVHDSFSSSRTEMGLIDGVPYLEYGAAMVHTDNIAAIKGLGRFFKIMPACTTTLSVYNDRLLMKCRFNLEQWPALVVTEIWKDLYKSLIDEDTVIVGYIENDSHKRELLAQGKFLLKYFYPQLSLDAMLFAASDLNMVTQDLTAFAEIFNAIGQKGSDTHKSTKPVMLPDTDYIA